MLAGTGVFRLLNEWQRGFPLEPHPYAVIAERHGIDESDVLAAYRVLIAENRMSRIGVVFRPNTVGASTLAAMSVPSGRLYAVARQVSSRPEVNHNYQREHALNLWFVVAASTPSQVESAIAEIENDTSIPVLRLPLLEEFHIDLGFDLAERAERGTPATPRQHTVVRHVELDAVDRSLVAALDDGIPLEHAPYAVLGAKTGMTASQVIDRLGAWLHAGIVRRIGTVVRHRSVGYRSNAMVVWDVPDDVASALGHRAARHPAVTLCYRRARAAGWPYNLYCMLHGREQDVVRAAIRDVTAAAGLDAYESATLFSLRCFTQRGARYSPDAARNASVVAQPA